MLTADAGGHVKCWQRLAEAATGYDDRLDLTVHFNGPEPRRIELSPSVRYVLLPPVDDIHYVRTISETPSISIHLLANDTACIWRHRFDPESGVVTPFRSGYANAKCPDR